jgi:hypothetical protein
MVVGVKVTGLSFMRLGIIAKGFRTGRLCSGVLVARFRV